MKTGEEVAALKTHFMAEFSETSKRLGREAIVAGFSRVDNAVAQAIALRQLSEVCLAAARSLAPGLDLTDQLEAMADRTALMVDAHAARKAGHEQ